MKLVIGVPDFNRMPPPIQDEALDWIASIIGERYSFEVAVLAEGRARILASTARFMDDWPDPEPFVAIGSCSEHGDGIFIQRAFYTASPPGAHQTNDGGVTNRAEMTRNARMLDVVPSLLYRSRQHETTAPRRAGRLSRVRG